MSESEYDDGIDAADQDMVATAESKQNWLGIGVALFLIFVIFALVILAIFLVTPKHKEFVLGEPITYTESINWQSQLRSVNYQWSTNSDNDLFYYLNPTTGDIMQISFDSTSNVTLSLKTFLDKYSLYEGYISDFCISSDNTVIAIPYNYEQLFRHSYKAQYKLVSFSSENASNIDRSNIIQTVLKAGSDTKNPDENLHASVQNVKWGKKGRFMVFVYRNNIYYTKDALKIEASKITDNKNDSNIAFGASSWLYEEEILYKSRAMWISSSCEFIAFLKFNETNVRKYYMPWYGSPMNVYLNYRPVNYPKAGDSAVLLPNPDVSVGIFTVEKNSTVYLKRPYTVLEDNYVILVRWFNETHLIVGWLNREQTTGTLAIYNAKIGVSTGTIIYHGTTSYGWMELTRPRNRQPIIDASNDRIFLLMHNNDYRRIVELKVSHLQVDGSSPNEHGNQLRWITPAMYDVEDIVHFDKESQKLYFLSCRMTTDLCDPTVLHLHVIDVRVTDSPLPAYCITCNATVTNQTCEYNKATFSPSGTFIFQSCLGPDPFSFYIRYNKHPDYPVIKVVENNDEFRKLLIGKHVPVVIFKDIELKSRSKAEALTVRAKILMPRQLNESHISQYPLVINVYGGPTVQFVTKRFDFGWHTYLASSLFVITASIDGRGTANRGSKFMFSIKNNVANVEVEDQLDALAELRKLVYVNKSSIAVFGWSYGGFVAMHMLGHWKNVNNSYFKTGVAVAPVTDFSYYDTAYTERYLGIRTDKTASNYDRTAVEKRAANFWNKDFLLIHGTGDDNVHYANSAHVVKALIEANADFEFMTYPDSTHSLGDYQHHVYRKVTTFLINSFNETSEKYRFLNKNTHKWCEVATFNSNEKNRC